MLQRKKHDKQTDALVELNNCTFVKSVLMLLVVLYHCVVFWTGTWFSCQPANESAFLSVLAGWLNSFHIYGFALVSGYLFYYLKYEKGKYAQYIPFLKQKAKRLLVPFAFVAAVWVIPISYLFFSFDLGEFVSKYILGIAPAQLWFLLMLFGVFALFYPLSNFMKENQVLGAVAILGIYGIGLVGQTVLPNLFQAFRACMYMPIFWLGFKLRQWGSSWLNRIPALLWLLAHILLFVLMEYLKTSSGVIFTLMRLGLDFVLHVVGALMAFAVLQKLANKINWQKSKVFGFVGKLSMPVYLLHQQIIYVCIYFLNGHLNPYIHATVNFICAMGISLALSALLMRFRITRVLIGEK